MTEKRFKIADYPTDIIDTVTGKEYRMSSYYPHMEIICDLLNELHEENHQLQNRIKELELLNDGLNYVLKYIRQIDVEIDIDS